MVPGPMIEVFEGDTVRIRLENRLPQDTTVHWHGLPVPPSQDGNPMDPIAPGASRTYEFTLPVGSAGTYWYHPHTHEHTAEQVFRGMAGLFVVRSRTDPMPAAIEEKLLVISDLRLASDGSIPANTAMDWQNGREGNYVLVNGQYQPALSINPGQSQRWRILNATNARYLRLALDQHAFTLIGTDGGLLGDSRSGTERDPARARAARRSDRYSRARCRRLGRCCRACRTSAATMGMGMMGSALLDIPLLTSITRGPLPAGRMPTALRPIAPFGAPTATNASSSHRAWVWAGMGRRHDAVPDRWQEL